MAKPNVAALDQPDAPPAPTALAETSTKKGPIAANKQRIAVLLKTRGKVNPKSPLRKTL